MPTDAHADVGSQPAPAPYGRRRWGVACMCCALVAFAALVYVFVPWAQVFHWAAQEQRAFQNAMAVTLRAIRGGDWVAVFALCGATAAYGFIHALGPGHGKILLGGAALASGATMKRMAVLTLLSGLMQAASAILLVACTALFLGWAIRDLIGLTERWLAHGPTVSEVKSLSSKREALALIASIGIRPCTGALFVLIISMRMDIFAIGCLAVMTMGLGTAAFNLIIAASGVMARRLAALPLESRAMRQFSAGVHIAGGALIALMSAGLVWTSFNSPILTIK